PRRTANLFPLLGTGAFRPGAARAGHHRGRPRQGNSWTPAAAAGMQQGRIASPSPRRRHAPSLRVRQPPVRRGHAPRVPSEQRPQLARRADRYAIVRSLTHTGVNHGTSAYHVLTGHVHFTPGTLRHPTPDDFPSVGCAAARFGRQPRDVPAYVALPSVLHDGDGGEVPGQGPGLLGQRHAPFLVNGDPTRPDFSIDTLTLPRDLNGGRFRDRIGLQAA